MRRLLVTCEYPPIAGGQGSYFKNLWSGLDPEQNLILVPFTSDRNRQEDLQSHFAFMRIPAGEQWFQRFVRIFLVFIAMLRYSISFRPREIHAGQLIAGGFCSFLIRIMLGIPYCVHCHGADLLEFSRYRLARPAIKAILSNSRRIITNSNYTARLIRERYNPSVPVAIVAPCAEDRFFSYDPTVMERLGKRFPLKNKKVMLTVGRLVERKGHDVVLRSLPKLQKIHSNIHYLVAGEGPFRLNLEILARKLGVIDNVTFCGLVKPEELPALYHCATIFVMVPRLIAEKGDVEGFGIVYLEANATGLPVVASRSGGIPDAVEHETNGLLVNDPTDVDEVTAVLDRLLSDENLRLGLAKNSVGWARKFSRSAQRRIWQDAVR